jgi:hypothetical protein
MNVEIFVISVAKHFNHLLYALRSIEKFAHGFSRCRVLIPRCDIGKLRDEVMPLVPDFKNGFPIVIEGFDEWPNQGMLAHMYAIMCSDQYCPDANFILHFDSDCVFTEPVTPEDYFVNGNPVLMYASFDWLFTQQANLLMWQAVTANAIGGEVKFETMRRHPAVHYRELYPLARDAIEKHTGKNMIQFMREQKNEFPQSFCEYVTLGNVAWREMRNKYHWRDQQTEGFPPSKLHQSWSHADPSSENMELYRKLVIA